MKHEFAFDEQETMSPSHLENQFYKIQDFVSTEVKSEPDFTFFLSKSTS